MVGEDRVFGSLSEEGRYRLLIEAVTDYAIYMLDTDGVVTSWNPGARRFKGYEANEIIGQHFSRFYSEEDRNAGLPARVPSPFACAPSAPAPLYDAQLCRAWPRLSIRGGLGSGFGDLRLGPLR